MIYPLVEEVKEMQCITYEVLNYSFPYIVFLYLCDFIFPKNDFSDKGNF